MSQPSPKTAFLTAEQRVEFEHAVARFEQEWFSGRRPAIEPFLSGDGEFRSVLLAELVRVDLEFRTKAGEACRVEDYLARFPELSREDGLGPSIVVGRPAVGPGGSVGRPATTAPEPSRRAGTVDLRERLVASRLVTEKQVGECLAAMGKEGRATVEQLAGELLRRGWMTRWQLEQLVRGQTAFFVDQGRYVLLSLIGKGGMGAVYKARHVRMNRDVALKVIDPKRVSDQSLIQRFKREVEVCSKLQHEHIVQAFDVGEYAGATFLVLEFVEGSDLASLVKRDGAMQPGEAAAICLQAAAGLAYAHSQGIVHRDIKPQNILLSTGGVVKILDMGLARVLDEAGDDPHTSLTQEGAVMGTVDYMPPEQARDTKSADARSDIYSLGGTLYYLLAGRPPFAGGSVIEKMQRLANESAASLSEIRLDCPRELEEIVQKMLAKRPEDRFQTAGDVVRALKPLAAERIAGRAVVTAAVQSAADTLHPAATVPTDADVLFSHMDTESLATRMRQRTATGPALNRKQRLKLAAIAGLLMVVVAALGWSLSRRSIPDQDDAAHPEPPPTSAIATRSLKPTIVPELPFHYGGVSCVAWSGDGQYLAVGSADGDVDVRTPSSVTRVLRYARHRAGVVGVGWVPGREWIVSADVAGGIHIWRARTGELVRELRRARIDIDFDAEPGPALHGATGFTCSPDGKEIAYSAGKTVVRYSIPDFKKLDSLPLESSWWHELRYSPSSRLLAVAWYDHGDSGVAVHDLKTGKTILNIEREEFPGSGDGVEILMSAFQTENELAVARPGHVQIWFPTEGKVEREFPVEGLMPNTADGFLADGTEFAFWKADGLRLVSTTDGKIRHFEIPRSQAPNDLRIWDITSRSGHLCNFINYFDGLQIVRLNDGKTTRPWGTEIYGTATPGRGRPPAIHGEFILEQPSWRQSDSRSWDLRTAELRGDLAGKFYTVSEDRMLRILEGDEIHTRPNDEGATSDSAPVTTLNRWNELEPRFIGHPFFSGDGSRLFRWEDNDILHVWDTPSGRKISAFKPLGYSNLISVAYDGRSVAVGGSAMAGATLLWREPYEGIPDKMPGNPPAYPELSFSAASGFLAWMPGTVFRMRDGRQFGLPSRPLTYNWFGVFSRSGAYLLNDLEIWRLTGAKSESAWRCPDEARGVHRLGHLPTLIGNCWFDDERHVALTYDASINVWDWRENKKLASLYFFPEDNWAFVNHETGHYNGTPGADRYLRCERGKGDDLISLRPAVYRRQIGWENDPQQAGLDLEKRKRELGAGRSKGEDGK
jgi:WD40 repeat protein/tRNA A-37 threonylcarbamoyl transferase component Bud32